jgi:hypothetical protein
LTAEFELLIYWFQAGSAGENDIGARFK